MSPRTALHHNTETYSLAVMLGVWEGILIWYLIESNHAGSTSNSDSALQLYADTLAAWLAFGASGCIFLDYTVTGDLETFARSVAGMTVGVVVAEIARHGLTVRRNTNRVVASHPRRRHHRRRIRTQSDEEVLEGSVSLDAAEAFLSTVHPTAPANDATTTTTTTRTYTTSAASTSSRPRPSIITTSTTTTTEPTRRVPTRSVSFTQDGTGRRDAGVGPAGEAEIESEQSLDRDIAAPDRRRRSL